ncbi:MAG: hypothetical protein US57_C0011G0064 [Candidatus Moranbacteria bacterium GW2011_GWC2_37_73]|nr:MAG: hypothetical protein UR95_C0006G0114 [Parcubacteria group bacterium GW2011_GWC1_36_108]KKQ00506.1 MAG: hypothetical protein US09_C0011G0064 [Candidatus Moranbacteria bacterium GW2011_GWD1_36_198]KKQ30100.1 MAG: hypothetical protein US47_C0006G0002 [Candidatus Moranbacteria bacterium GW2011_GWE1_37_24]KKQ39576.1 MAG: hypothetical protein US57_C0011G0064 [Candidatus Moranbacteria bacterium GW2011_GWC2_37_73]HAR99991.1 hypothetical protein [Candidatus Moranbacteria bacterium]
MKTAKQQLSQKAKFQWLATFALLEMKWWTKEEWLKLYKKLDQCSTPVLFELFDLVFGVPQAKVSVVRTLAKRDDYNPVHLVKLMRNSWNELSVRESIAEVAEKRPGKYLLEMIDLMKGNYPATRKLAVAIASFDEFTIEDMYPIWKKNYSCEISDALEIGFKKRLHNMPTKKVMEYLLNSDDHNLTGIYVAVLLQKGDYEIADIVNPILLYATPANVDIRSGLVRLAREKIHLIPKEQLAPFIEACYCANNLWEFILDVVKLPDCPFDVVKKSLQSGRLSGPHEATVLITVAKNNEYSFRDLCELSWIIHIVGNDEKFAEALVSRDDINTNEIFSACMNQEEKSGLQKLAPYMIEHLLSRIQTDKLWKLFECDIPNLQVKIIKEMYEHGTCSTRDIFLLMEKAKNSMVQMAIVTGCKERAGATMGMLEKALPYAIASEVVKEILSSMVSLEECEPKLLLKNFGKIPEMMKKHEQTIFCMIEKLRSCQNVEAIDFGEIENGGFMSVMNAKTIAISSLPSYKTHIGLNDFLSSSNEDVQLSILSAVGDRNDLTIGYLLEMAVCAKGKAEAEVIARIKKKSNRISIKKLLEAWNYAQGEKAKKALLEMINSRRGEIEVIAVG